jgi:hypothetical protein
MRPASQVVDAPGYFDYEASQARNAESLRRDGVSLVLWDETFMFDGRPDRHSSVTHAGLLGRVSADCARVGSIDGFTVFMDRAELTHRSFVLVEVLCL